MSYGVEIAESAERDIADVADVVAFAYGDPIGASRLAQRILDAAESLSEMPARYPLSRNPALAALAFRFRQFRRSRLFSCQNRII